MRCAQCCRDLDPNEPVWRVEVAANYQWPDRGHGTIRSVCAQCQATFHGGGRNPMPCCHCGRPVSLSWNRKIPRYVACGPRCRQAAHSAAYRAARQRTRPHTCATCQQKFTAKRPDATYCSPACRQKAYRARTPGG